MEELPTRPNPIVSAPIVVVVPIPNPAPAATPAPTATPAPAPAPTPAPDRGSIDSVRVAFFGISCSGKPKPPNGARQLPVGCTGFVTATPKDKNNVDVPEHIHGPNSAWNLRWGQNTVQVRPPTFANAFNKDLLGMNVGEFSLCATVKGVGGCLNGTVTP